MFLLSLQVEAGKAALQAQAETRAALAASQEVNEKLLTQQKADRDALAALQEEVSTHKQTPLSPLPPQSAPFISFCPSL